MQKIVGDFNKKSYSLLRKLEAYLDDTEEIYIIDNIRRKLRMINFTSKSDVLIKISAPHFIKYSEQIQNNDERFFINLSNSLIKNSNPMSDLIKCLQKVYSSADADEKAQLISDINIMLLLCISWGEEILRNKVAL